MEKVIKYACGVDISKKKFDACFISLDDSMGHKVKGTKKFDNTTSGIKSFCIWLESKAKRSDIPLFVLVEATGVYHEDLAYGLSKNGFRISVVLPNKSKKYLQSLGFKSKNDKIDAFGLSLMCAQQKLTEFIPLDPFYYELRSLTRFYQNIQESITALGNQLHAVKHGYYSSPKIISEIRTLIKTKKDLLKRVVKQMRVLVKSRTDISEKIARIEKVKGIGFLTIVTVLAETGGFESFDNIPGLVSYAGYDVIENQSGMHVGKTKISKKGNSRIRRVLHLPSLVAVKYEPSFNAFYNRVFERSFIPMKGYVAVQKKMLVLIYAMWKNGTEFNPELYLQNESSTDKTVLHKVEN